MSKSFNTQPPEGGWLDTPRRSRMVQGFNTQPPEGGWTSPSSNRPSWLVSTHSRLKAAGYSKDGVCHDWEVSTHSRLKAAGNSGVFEPAERGGFNTQPPEGGWRHHYQLALFGRGFNTQPPEGGWLCYKLYALAVLTFQHTAA